ncbi:hypothetical protein [Halosolutus halophilus]|uniref:hypothetical protein n=1 Tax=Halosolutus halophilus TaxID=1552990 RepID=UPI0022350197|nr:hypothetical protein [Halosolutus halophilus]
MKSLQRLGISLVGIGIGFVLISYLIEIYSRSFFINSVMDPFSIGIVYSVFGVVVVGWGQVSQSRSLPLHIALLTAGMVVVIITGTELARRPLVGRELHWIIMNYTNPSHYVGFCVTWLFSIILADLDSYSSQQIGSFCISGLVFILLIPLAAVLTAGHTLAIALPIWVVAGGIVVAIAGIYTFPVYYLQNQSQVQ